MKKIRLGSDVSKPVQLRDALVGGLREGAPGERQEEGSLKSKWRLRVPPLQP